jgi:hypothetical protein
MGWVASVARGLPLTEPGVAVDPGAETESASRLGGGPPGLLGERISLGMDAV